MREIIKKIGETLFFKGLSFYKEGNISVKIENIVYITASGVIKGNLKDTDILAWDIREFPPDNISSEWRMHKAIYQNTDANVIIHLHSLYTSLISANKNIISPVIQEDELYLKDIKFVKNVPFGTEELAKEVEKVLTENENTNMLILENHGIVAWGNDYEELVFRLYGVEKMLERMVLNTILKREN